MNNATRWALLGGLLLVGAAAIVLLMLDDGVDDDPAAETLQREVLAVGEVADIEPAPASEADDPIEDGAARLLTDDPGGPPREAAAVDEVAVRRITGVVVRASDGTPVTGAMVAALSPRTGDFNSTAYSTLTDADGRFDHQRVPFTCGELQIRGEQLIENVDIDPGTEELVGVVFEVDTGCILFGVVMGAHGRPLAEAHVSVAAGTWSTEEDGTETYDGQRLDSVKTDAVGEFEIRDVAVPEGSATLTVSASAEWHVKGEQEIRAPDGPERVGPIELRLVAGGTIEGTVTDGLGQPLDGAIVRVRWQMTTRHVEDVPDQLEARSRSGGNYQIHGVPPGRFMVSAVKTFNSPRSAFEANHPAPECWFIDVPVSEGETTYLDIQLAAGAVVAGRVADTAGNPVAGVELELRRVVSWPAPDTSGSMISSIGSEDGPVKAQTGPGADGVMRTEFSRREAVATTDVNGEYRIAGVTPGDKQLVGSGVGDSWLTPTEHDFTVSTPTEVHLDKDFTVGAGLTLRGRIVDELGVPIPGVAVVVQALGASTWALDDAARTGEDGRFAVNGLPDQKMRLWIYKPEYRNHWDEVRAGGADLEIVLVPAQQIRGIVYDAATREPLTEYDLTTKLPNATMGMSVHDEDGMFATNADEDGPYEVTIEAVGYEAVSIPDVHPADTMQTPLMIYLRRL